LARRVTDEMGNEAGLVRCRVGAWSRSRRNAKLMYVTDHSLLNECRSDPLFSNYSVVFVDEAHERSIFTDLLLGFLKMALLKRLECLINKKLRRY